MIGEKLPAGGVDWREAASRWGDWQAGSTYQVVDGEQASFDTAALLQTPTYMTSNPTRTTSASTDMMSDLNVELIRLCSGS